MFSGALKSFSSNISSNYTISAQPSSVAGPWKIFEARRKGTGKVASVFVFDKKSLDAGSSNGLSHGKGNAASLKRAQEEIIERLKREASSLARLRHPSILELVEPVEETRNGGLMFATEPVTASLSSLLAEKDEQESSGSVKGRGSKYMVEEQDGTKQQRELEIDELEIQKGLLQLGKGLEFLHESAGLVHGNLTPDAILINAKGDWKIAGLGFCGPFENSTAATSLVAISLHEVLNYDPRLPRLVQLNLDYSSPDFVLDNNLVASADMFSLGLLIIALYNTPHRSPLSVAGSISTYKRAFSSSSGIPSRTNNFLVPSSNPLPPRLLGELLPRLITRRAAQRMTAKEFQDASYFDNILVSTLRFLESLPAKSASEKAAFLKGLKGIMPQFPPSVLEKKILPALLEEMKDKELLAPILIDVFAMVNAMPAGKRAFTERVVPRLREVFITNRTAEKDSAREAGLVVALESMPIIAENCAGKEFREDILPIVVLAMESPTPSLVAAGLGTLCSILPVLDFSTIKNDLFPVIATCFSKTNSLAIKIKGLEAFYLLCGGDSSKDTEPDDLSGVVTSVKRTMSAILDKYTVQEKVIPLLKGIRTKEPGVMMAALRVFRQVSDIVDSDFLAMEVLPILWSFSLGPLLNLQQFQSFISLIKTVGSKIEVEHTKKLQELGTGNASVSTNSVKNSSNSLSLGSLESQGEADFEALVSGRKAAGLANNDDLMNDWAAVGTTTRPDVNRTQSQVTNSPAFSWQTGAPLQPTQKSSSSITNILSPSRTITPDHTLGGFAALTPASQWTAPLQPTQSLAQSSNANGLPSRTIHPLQNNSAPIQASIDWSAATSASTSAWSNTNTTQNTASNAFGATSRPGNFALPPPPVSNGLGHNSVTRQQQQNGTAVTKATTYTNELDKYESLL